MLCDFNNRGGIFSVRKMPVKSAFSSKNAILGSFQSVSPGNISLPNHYGAVRKRRRSATGRDLTIQQPFLGSNSTSGT